MRRKCVRLYEARICLRGWLAGFWLAFVRERAAFASRFYARSRARCACFVFVPKTPKNIYTDSRSTTCYVQSVECACAYIYTRPKSSRARIVNVVDGDRPLFRFQNVSMCACVWFLDLWFDVWLGLVGAAHVDRRFAHSVCVCVRSLRDSGAC